MSNFTLARETVFTLRQPVKLAKDGQQVDVKEFLLVEPQACHSQHLRQLSILCKKAFSNFIERSKGDSGSQNGHELKKQHQLDDKVFEDLKKVSAEIIETGLNEDEIVRFDSLFARFACANPGQQAGTCPVLMDDRTTPLTQAIWDKMHWRDRGALAAEYVGFFDILFDEIQLKRLASGSE